MDRTEGQKQTLDDGDVEAHGVMTQHNETTVGDEHDVVGHGTDFQHNETVVDDDVVGHGSNLNANETVVEDDDVEDVAGHGVVYDPDPGFRD